MLRGLAAFVLIAALLPASAQAYEDEWLVSVETGPGLRLSDASTTLGWSGQASAWIGLTPLIWLHVAGGGGQYLDGGPNHFEGVIGPVLTFDVLRTVPFLELGIGAEAFDGKSSFLGRVGLGADYLVSPDWGLGAVVRYHPAFRDEVEHVLELNLRLVFRGEMD